MEQSEIDAAFTKLDKYVRNQDVGEDRREGSLPRPASHAVNDFRKLCGIEAYTPTDNVSELTARTNDEGWDTVFAGWLAVSRGGENDAVMVFSVGGGNLMVDNLLWRETLEKRKKNEKVSKELQNKQTNEQNKDTFINPGIRNETDST